MGTFLTYLHENWLDIALVLVGLSAFIVYFFQKRDRLFIGGTLIVSQINSIEKSISSLKDDPQLCNVSVFYSKPIIKENMWESYKHLFAKRLTSSEYNCVQRFFDHAEQLERARNDIIGTITTAWKDKSIVEHEEVAKMIEGDCESSKIQEFIEAFCSLDLVFTPHLAINSLTKGLNDFVQLTGTSAYGKIQRHSYSK